METPQQTPEEKAEVKRKRLLVKNKLYPFLEMSSENVEDAKNFTQSVTIAIRQAFNNKMRKSTLGSLKLQDMLDKESKDYKRYKFVLDLFKDETIHDSIELIDGMTNAISAFITREMLKRKLNTLETDFLE
jgi:hypothetical protein